MRRSRGAPARASGARTSARAWRHGKTQISLLAADQLRYRLPPGFPRRARRRAWCSRGCAIFVAVCHQGSLRLLAAPGRCLRPHGEACSSTSFMPDKFMADAPELGIEKPTVEGRVFETRSRARMKPAKRRSAISAKTACQPEKLVGKPVHARRAGGYGALGIDIDV